MCDSDLEDYFVSEDSDPFDSWCFYPWASDLSDEELDEIVIDYE